MQPNSSHASEPSEPTGPCRICTSPDVGLIQESIFAPVSTSTVPTVDSSLPESQADDVDPYPVLPRHQIRTISQSGISKPKHFPDFELHGLLAALLAQSKPKGIKSALKHPGWVEAMNEELPALKSNHTWTLVTLYPLLLV